MTMQGNAHFDQGSVIDDLDDEDEMDSAELENFAYDLNARHHVSFQRRGPELLIAFDVAPDQVLPLARKHARLEALAREMDWSLLSLVSRGETWFRDPEVITFFDALADGTLLDQFSSVLFYGAGSGGHAALSYALAAPFSRILALSPQRPEAESATRYAPVAENLAAAEHVYIARDPAHADGLTAPNMLPLSCRYMGQRLEDTLIDFGILDDIVCDAMDGTLAPSGFYRLLRARRDNTAYLRGIVARTIDTERPVLEALTVRNIAQRMGRNRYARRFEKLREDLAARGITVPPGRVPPQG